MKKDYTYRKIQRKRETSFQKAAYILKPFVIYLILKTMMMLGLSLVVSSMQTSSLAMYFETHGQLVSAVVNALASIIAVAFVIKDFLTEVDTSGEVQIDQRAGKQILQCMKKGLQAQKGNGLALGIILSLSISSSLFLNGLLSHLPVQSEKYTNVEKIQYSVPIWLGIILYGIVSPVVEEIVFRGITYHRMRRFFSIPLCVIVSSLIFGGFHANLPQFLYGTGMGILIALCYEWNRTFCAPLLFHTAANVFVFVSSHIKGLNDVISTFQGIAVFFILSVVFLFLLRQITKKNT